MMTVPLPSVLPLLVILVPVLGAVAVALFGHRQQALISLALGCALLCLGLVVVLITTVRQGFELELALMQLAPPMRIELSVDALGALFALTIAALFPLALIYALKFLADDDHLQRFVALTLAAQGLMLGVAFAGNLITLFAFYELFSLISYPLIVHDRSPRALAAGLKYIIYIVLGGVLILTGVIVVFALAGDLSFTASGLLDADTAARPALLAWICLIAGFGVKAALMPLHGWVADAHPAAPPPFSAILSGVMVAAGSFGILRVLFDIFGVELLAVLGVMPWLAVIAGLTAVLAGMLAIGEDEFKRRLAYSTISQMAYVALAIAMLSEVALVGALAHISHHAFIKAGLFFAAGLIVSVTGLKKVSEFDGLARRMPATAVLLTLLSLAMIGVPPLSGFLSKWLLGIGLMGAGGALPLAVLVAGTLLAAAYLWPVIFRIWLPGQSDTRADSAMAGQPKTLLAVLAATALITLILGLAATVPGLPLELARLAAAQLMGGSG